jgi:transposase
MGMQRLQAYKFAVIPSGGQQRQMRAFAGSCRFVFNKALALQKQLHEDGEKRFGACVCEFLAKRAEFPRFKKKGQKDSFRYPDAKQIKLDQPNSRIFLPKLGWMRYRNSRKVLGAVRNVTVSWHNGKWFVSIQTERAVDVPIPKGDAIGIDMGIVRFATLSDGKSIEPLNCFRHHEVALRKAQQAMSRKTKFSSNWRKAKKKVQRIREEHSKNTDSNFRRVDGRLYRLEDRLEKHITNTDSNFREVHKRLDQLDKRFDTLTLDIVNAIASYGGNIEKMLSDHESRLVALETTVAP